MKKLKITRKVTIYTGVALLTTALIIFLTFWFVNAPYRSKIPALPDFKSYSVLLQEQIKDADNKAHKNPSADNIGFLGMVYQSCSEYEKAIDCYKLAVKRNESQWFWKYLLGYLYKEMGQSENAISCFSAIVKEHSNIWHAWYYLGEGFYKIQSYDQAEIAFSRIPFLQPEESSTSRADLYPLQIYSKYQIARIYLNKKNLDKTEEILKEIIKNSNSFGPTYRLLANVYNAKGDSSWSKYYKIRASDLTDYTPPVDTLIDRIAQISKSELYLLKQIDESIKSYNIEWTFSLLNNALNNIPDNQYIISKGVKLYLKLDNVEQALPLLTRHLTLFAGDFNELKEVADLLYSKNQYSKALLYYSQLEKLKPGNPEIISGKALALSGDNKKAEAVKIITKLVEESNYDIPALKEAIYFLIVEEEKAKAKDLLAILKQKAPSDVKVFKYTGMLADMEGNASEAISAYEKAFKLDPDDITTIQYLGNTLLQQKMWKKALDLFRQGLAIHPNNPYLLERVGTLLVTCQDKSLRNYPLAKEFSERAYINVASAPEIMISASRSLGLSYYYLGDKSKAKTFLNITLNLAKQANYPAENIQELEQLIQNLKI